MADVTQAFSEMERADGCRRARFPRADHGRRGSRGSVARWRDGAVVNLDLSRERRSVQGPVDDAAYRRRRRVGRDLRGRRHGAFAGRGGLSIASSEGARRLVDFLGHDAVLSATTARCPLQSNSARLASKTGCAVRGRDGPVAARDRLSDCPRTEAQSACDALAGYQMLAAWVGEWTVTNPAGARAGSSRVERSPDGCGLIEHWEGVNPAGTACARDGPARLRSPAQSWRHLWVDATGFTAPLSGKSTAERSSYERRRRSPAGSSGGIAIDACGRRWHHRPDRRAFGRWRQGLGTRLSAHLPAETNLRPLAHSVTVRRVQTYNHDVE